MPCKKVLDHLSQLYAASEDPWQHRSSAYEAEKFDATLAAIGQGPFGLALEIGCGNGTLARHIAGRCHRLIAVECIPSAAQLARTALADLTQVIVIEGAAPQQLPDIHPDLVVLSEVLYFMEPDEIRELASWLLARSRGPIVAVNWSGPTDELLDGSSAVELLAVYLGRGLTSVHGAYRIDQFYL